MSDKYLRAIILTPRDSESESVASAIGQGLKMAGFDVARFNPPMDAVIQAIASADLVVADLTSQSPSVYYELGFAHGLRKRTILVTSNESAAQLPTDLRGFLYFAYDRSDLTDLVEQIRREARVSSRAAVAMG